MKYLHEYSVMRDTLYYCIHFFSFEEFSRQVYENEDGMGAGMQFYYMLCASVGIQPPAHLKPFFYYANLKTSLLSLYLSSFINPTEASIDNVMALLRTPEFYEYAIRYYFDEDAYAPSPDDIRTGQLSHFIAMLRLPEDFKLYITYCLEHFSLVLDEIEKLLRNVYPHVEKLHIENTSLRFSTEESLRDPVIRHALFSLLTSINIPKDYEIGNWGMSLLNPVIVHNGYNNLYIFFGFNFTDTLKKFGKKDPPTVKGYEEIIADPQRRAMLQLLRERGPLTYKEVQDALQISSSTMSWQQNVLIVSGIVETLKADDGRWLRRLREEYFDGLAQAYKEYSLSLRQLRDKTKN